MRLTARRETWPVAGAFTISRGTYTSIDVVVVEVEDDAASRGRGECRPYARYEQTPESVLAQIESVRARVESHASRETLRSLLPRGAARNAIDAALWDLEAKRAGVRAFTLAGLPEPLPTRTAYTISLDRPDAMAQAARAANRPLLKLKLGGDGDEDRVLAVRAAVPDATLIVDANEAWTPATLDRRLDAMAKAHVALVEQPLHAAADAALRAGTSPVPICADESCHGLEGLDAVLERYDAVNVKLDKTGGLTEAIEVVRRAREMGRKVMVGCMLGTSLAMAPARLLASLSDFVDLDGPLLLARDREHGLEYDGALVGVPSARLWG
ncbi:MAG: dipeptide epimerase [Planctomycetes bacterium]|nr:dipeptide epimerase [Planctomycetota bacterium]MCC7168807.1 dipeptide epimerase [Planctomycetota bacterium]